MPAASMPDLHTTCAQRRRSPRVLIGGVGYRNLRDLSLGPVLADRLTHDSWPEGIEIEDLSYGPIGVMHNLDDRPPYDRLILFAGVKRGREPGRVFSYRWGHRLPPADEIQARVAEAVTGVISLDNLLIILEHFGKLPKDVVVVEVEAVEEGWGEDFTPPVQAAMPSLIAEIRCCACDEILAARKTLVAGFGNVLLGDDGFGVRVLKRLSTAALPDHVQLLDVGIGGFDLVLKLMEGFDELVVVDAARRHQAPGTLYQFTPSAGDLHDEGWGVDAHLTEPTRALKLVRALGSLPAKVTVIACEPRDCAPGLELSPEVARAVDQAEDTIRRLIGSSVSGSESAVTGT